jgi:hypothetical protein
MPETSWPWRVRQIYAQRASYVLDLMDGPGAVAGNARALGAAPVLALAHVVKNKRSPVHTARGN